MSEETACRCRVCGVAAVPAPGQVCTLHLRVSERELVAAQARKPSAGVLGVQQGATVGRSAPERESQRVSEAPVEVAGLELASVSQRFYAFLIDVFAATVIAAFLAAFASASPAAAVVLGLGGWWGYFLLANSIGQLAGKATLGIKVVDPATGREPGFVKGTLRTIGQAIGLILAVFLGSLTFGFGFLVLVWLMVTWDVRNVTIHDAMGGTEVVRTTWARR